MRKLILIYTIMVLVLNCEKQEDTHSASENIVAQIELERGQKDISFKNDADSPIPDKDKAEFTGLSYFPVDLKYRLQLPLREHKSKEVFKIITSRGMQRDTEKFGYFDFELAGKTNKLHVYKILDVQARHPGHLFIPFTDETSGNECYGGGRYLDLQQNDTGYYVVDFNQAYNPLCAYGKESYNCPIPPAENRLDIAIRAGEKGYALKIH